MTLIELLVVIVLLTTLVTTAIPIISPGGDERKIREASRSVNAYLQGAQARAIQTGRPYGVAFRRLSTDTDNPEHNAVCAQMRYVEVPPAYSGLDSSSLARLCLCESRGLKRLGLQIVRYGDDTLATQDGLPPGYDPELLPDLFFQAGDQIEIDGLVVVILPQIFGVQAFDTIQQRPESVTRTGHFAMRTANASQNIASRILGVRILNDESPRVVNDNGPGNYQPLLTSPQFSSHLRFTHNWKGEELGSPESLVNSDVYIREEQTVPSFQNGYLATAPAPFKVYRQPTLAGGEPLELPAGVAIDLQGSVFGNGARVYSPEYDYDGSPFRLRTDDFMVLFSPEGHIHRVHGLYTRASENAPVQAVDSQPVSSSLALLIGRRELIPATPQGVTGTPTYANYAEPIPINVNDYNDLPETEAWEVTDQYNWLNLQSQWVVIGGQSGSVTSIDNSAVYPSDADSSPKNGTVSISEQLTAALENAPRRSASGGR